jgi:hypothetical protein
MERIEMPCNIAKCSKRWMAGINAFNALNLLVKKCDDAKALLERLEKELS